GESRPRYAEGRTVSMVGQAAGDEPGRASVEPLGLRLRLAGSRRLHVRPGAGPHLRTKQPSRDRTPGRHTGARGAEPARAPFDRRAGPAFGSLSILNS